MAAGQLGDGTTTPSSVPVAIVDTGAGTTLSGVTQISAGAAHACAVLVDGTARCWGFNGSGQLGDSTTANSSVPVIVTTSAGTALSGVIQISAGGFYTCAVLNDGTARCWGSNGDGQLGNDSAASSSVPVIVTTSAGTALSGIIHISAGVTKTCALLADTTARCWGRNTEGRLGDGTTTPSSLPVTVVDTGVGTTLSGITQVFAGYEHACAVVADTTARCWGNNGAGRLGDGTTTNRSVPVTVTTGAGTALSGITQISLDFQHSCAMLVDTTARCWGNNAAGQLGDGTTTNRSVPVAVTTSAGTALSGITQISAANFHTCAVLVDTTARCWGNNGSGRLGDGTTTQSPIPVTVLHIGNPGWPATVTVSVTDSAGRTSSVNVTLTYQ